MTRRLSDDDYSDYGSVAVVQPKLLCQQSPFDHSQPQRHHQQWHLLDGQCRHSSYPLKEQQHPDHYTFQQPQLLKHRSRHYSHPQVDTKSSPGNYCSAMPDALHRTNPNKISNSNRDANGISYIDRNCHNSEQTQVQKNNEQKQVDYKTNSASSYQTDARKIEPDTSANSTQHYKYFSNYSINQNDNVYDIHPLQMPSQLSRIPVSPDNLSAHYISRQQLSMHQSTTTAQPDKSRKSLTPEDIRFLEMLQQRWHPDSNGDIIYGSASEKKIHQLPLLLQHRSDPDTVVNTDRQVVKRQPAPVRNPIKERYDITGRFQKSSRELQTSQMYHRKMSSKQATYIISNQQIGSFLIRDSSTSTAYYTLTFKDLCGTTLNRRICYTMGLFYLEVSYPITSLKGIPSCKSIVGLIELYVQHSKQIEHSQQTRQRTQFLDDVYLTEPIRCVRVQSLRSLARLTINKSIKQGDRKLVVDILKTADTKSKQYLSDYPYTI